MASSSGKRKQHGDQQEGMNFMAAQRFDGSLTLHLLKIRKELVDLLTLLKAL